MTASLYQSAGDADAAARGAAAGDVASGRASPPRVVASAVLLPPFAPGRPTLGEDIPALDLARRSIASPPSVTLAGWSVRFKGTSLPFTTGDLRTTRFTRGCFIARARRCARRRARDARSCAGRASDSERRRAGRARRRRDPGRGRAPQGRGRAIPTPSGGARATPRTG